MGSGDFPVERHKYHSEGTQALALFQTPAHGNSKNDPGEEVHMNSGRRKNKKRVRKRQKSRRSRLSWSKFRNILQQLPVAPQN